MPKNREQRRRATKREQKAAAGYKLHPRCLARSVAQRHDITGKGWQKELWGLLDYYKQRQAVRRKVRRVQSADCSGVTGGVVK